VSFATLDRAVWREAQEVLCNPRLKLKDVQEWNSGEIKPRTGEIVFQLPVLKINVAVQACKDKREKTNEG
jgi:hypothetical protein